MDAVGEAIGQMLSFGVGVAGHPVSVVPVIRASAILTRDEKATERRSEIANPVAIAYGELDQAKQAMGTIGELLKSVLVREAMRDKVVPGDRRGTAAR
jgi:hypothetical protein